MRSYTLLVFTDWRLEEEGEAKLGRALRRGGGWCWCSVCVCLCVDGEGGVPG